jgi:transposase
MVFEAIAERGDRHGAVTRVAQQLGIGPESLRLWVRQAEVDGGKRTGLTSEERERMKLLERENRALRRANEILKSAAAFFGFRPPVREVTTFIKEQRVTFGVEPICQTLEIASSSYYAARSPPMGLRVRLKSSYDTVGLSPQARVMAEALKRHGMVLADNGSPWFITGASDPRFNDDVLHELDIITGRDVEVVDTSGLVNGP